MMNIENQTIDSEYQTIRHQTIESEYETIRLSDYQTSEIRQLDIIQPNFQTTNQTINYQIHSLEFITLYAIEHSKHQNPYLNAVFICPEISLSGCGEIVYWSLSPKTSLIPYFQSFIIYI